MKKVIVSGAHGQLATDLLEVLNNTENQQFFDVIAYGRERLDVTHKDNLRSKFEEEKPDFFVQLASYHVVEDINNNPNNPVIGYRSFGEEKHNVTQKALAFIKGSAHEGVITCLKHSSNLYRLSIKSFRSVPDIFWPFLLVDISSFSVP